MTADEQKRLDQSGYVVLPTQMTIPREILAHLESLFEQMGENAGHAFRSDPFARNIDVFREKSGIFAPFLAVFGVLECVEHLLGPGFELASLQAHASNPFALALNPPALESTGPACWVLWLLDDFTGEGVAAVRVIPGSHHPNSQPETPVAIPLSGGAGTAVVLDGRLWIGPAPNPGSRHLRTLRCEYVQRGSSNSG